MRVAASMVVVILPTILDPAALLAIRTFVCFNLCLTNICSLASYQEPAPGSTTSISFFNNATFIAMKERDLQKSEQRRFPVQRIPPSHDYIRRDGAGPKDGWAKGPGDPRPAPEQVTAPQAEEPPAPLSPFVHLHVHSNFSFLDGGSRIEELVARAAELGQPALALTDHDGLYGAVRFAKACAKHGIKPIFGAEVRVESLLPPRRTPRARGPERGSARAGPPLRRRRRRPLTTWCSSPRPARATPTSAASSPPPTWPSPSASAPRSSPSTRCATTPRGSSASPAAARARWAAWSMPAATVEAQAALLAPPRDLRPRPPLRGAAVLRLRAPPGGPSRPARRRRLSEGRGDDGRLRHRTTPPRAGQPACGGPPPVARRDSPRVQCVNHWRVADRSPATLPPRHAVARDLPQGRPQRLNPADYDVGFHRDGRPWRLSCLTYCDTCRARPTTAACPPCSPLTPTTPGTSDRALHLVCRAAGRDKPLSGYPDRSPASAASSQGRNRGFGGAAAELMGSPAHWRRRTQSVPMHDTYNATLLHYMERRPITGASMGRCNMQKRCNACIAD